MEEKRRAGGGGGGHGFQLFLRPQSSAALSSWHINVFMNQEAPLSLRSRIFTGVSSHGYDYLSHWPRDSISFPVPLPSQEVGVGIRRVGLKDKEHFVFKKAVRQIGSDGNSSRDLDPGCGISCLQLHSVSLWWCILCINPPGRRDAQIAGKTFPGVSVRVSQDEIGF